MDERKLKDALRACLTGADFPPERRQAVLRAVRGRNEVVKRKLSVAMAFAIVMMLVLCGAAIAAGLGVFGQAANDAGNRQSAARLDRLEDAAAAVNDTQAAQAPSAAPAQPRTVRDTMLTSLYGRRFSLTLNQSYCDGRKLYYAYTLTTNAPLAWYEGEGMPTGFDSWDMQAQGRYAQHYTNGDEDTQARYVSFFDAHPLGYIGKESMCVGDGAAMNGEPLIILDSGETIVDACTIQGYQEVELPEGFTPEGDLSIELTILCGASVYCQDESSVYWAHVATPENRGILRLPFTVPLNGQTETLSGTVVTGAYSAAATVRVSDVDISGEVIWDAPARAAADMPLCDYTLVADGVEYRNLDGACGVNADGQCFLRVRYDLPGSTGSLTLRPTDSGIAGTEDAPTEHEEIVLVR